MSAGSQKGELIMFEYYEESANQGKNCFNFNFSNFFSFCKMKVGKKGLLFIKCGVRILKQMGPELGKMS